MAGHKKETTILVRFLNRFRDEDCPSTTEMDRQTKGKQSKIKKDTKEASLTDLEDSVSELNCNFAIEKKAVSNILSCRCSTLQKMYF